MRISLPILSNWHNSNENFHWHENSAKHLKGAAFNGGGVRLSKISWAHSTSPDICALIILVLYLKMLLCYLLYAVILVWYLIKMMYCVMFRLINRTSRCTGCWPSLSPCTPCASTRAFTHSSARNMETRCSACRKGEHMLWSYIYTLHIWDW